MTFSCIAVALPEHRCRRAIEIESPAVLLNHHTVITPRRFERYIAGAYIVEHPLGIALQRIPESAAAGGLDQKRISRIDLGRLDLSRRKFLHFAVLALDGNPIRQCVLAAVQSPRRAD